MLSVKFGWRCLLNWVPRYCNTARRLPIDADWCLKSKKIPTTIRDYHYSIARLYVISRASHVWQLVARPPRDLCLSLFSAGSPSLPISLLFIMITVSFYRGSLPCRGVGSPDSQRGSVNPNHWIFQYATSTLLSAMADARHGPAVLGQLARLFLLLSMLSHTLRLLNRTLKAWKAKEDPGMSYINGILLALRPRVPRIGSRHKKE